MRMRLSALKRVCVCVRARCLNCVALSHCRFQPEVLQLLAQREPFLQVG